MCRIKLSTITRIFSLVPNGFHCICWNTKSIHVTIPSLLMKFFSYKCTLNDRNESPLKNVLLLYFHNKFKRTEKKNTTKWITIRKSTLERRRMKEKKKICQWKWWFGSWFWLAMKNEITQFLRNHFNFVTCASLSGFWCVGHKYAHQY